jgi:pimeloyl-ACP methyl ester carboxylesterase
MDLHGPAGRRGAALVLLGMLASLAPAAAASPVPTIQITDVSIRPFGLGYVTNAYFAVADDGSVYLPGGTDGAALFRMAPDGSVTARWAGLEVVPGQPDTISGIAIDPATGDIWASDLTADRIVHLDADLVPLGTFGATGAEPGAFLGPGGLALEPGGTIVVADLGNDRLQRFQQDGLLLQVLPASSDRDEGSLPVDVAAAQDGRLLVSTLQPGLGRVVNRVPGDPVATAMRPGGTPDLLFPDAAITLDDNALVADAWTGLYVQVGWGELGPFRVPGMGTAPFAVRSGPGGDIWSLACQFSSTDCTLARMTPQGEVLATWHDATPPTLLGQSYPANGHQLYLQCVGDGSPTVLWIPGAGQPGWVGTQQYLMGKLSSANRFCTYDRLGVGFSDPGTDDDFAHWWGDVDDLTAVLDAAGETGPYVVAGYSYGGLLARLFAYQHPDEVVGLLAIDPSHEDQFAGPIDPNAPLGITTCSEASCPVFEDITRVHEITGGTVAGSLGDLPVVVLSHDPAVPFGATPEYDAWWLEMGADTATASTNGIHVGSSWSGHYLPYHHPGLVLEAISELVAAADGPDHVLPPCGAAFTALGGVCQ